VCVSCCSSDDSIIRVWDYTLLRSVRLCVLCPWLKMVGLRFRAVVTVEQEIGNHRCTVPNRVSSWA